MPYEGDHNIKRGEATLALGDTENEAKQSPYAVYGFRAGDEVSRQTEQGLETYTIDELTEWGAWLMNHQNGERYQSSNPDHYSMHGNRERAREVGVVQIKKLQSLDELPDLIRKLIAAGVDSNDIIIGTSAENIEQAVEFAIQRMREQKTADYATLDLTARNIRSGGGLREAIVELALRERSGQTVADSETKTAGNESEHKLAILTLELLRLDEGSTIEVEPITGQGKMRLIKVGEKFLVLQAEVDKKDYVATLTSYSPGQIAAWIADRGSYTVLKDIRKEQAAQELARKIQELRLMPEHAEIRIGNEIYERTEAGEFNLAQRLSEEDGSPKSIFHTLYSVEQMEQILNNCDLSTVTINYWPNEEERTPTMDEGEEGEIAHQNFAAALPKLYPKLYGPFRKEPNRADIERSMQKEELGQGNFGDCYLLAGIQTLKERRPDMYFDILARSIQRVGEGKWKVRFLGMDQEKLRDAMGDEYDDGWIAVTEEEVRHWEVEANAEIAKSLKPIERFQKHGVFGSLADKLLERAFASYVARVTTGQVGKTNKLNAEGKTPFEGGKSHRALHILLGNQTAEKRRVYCGDTPQFTDLITRVAEKPGMYLATAGTGENPDKTGDRSFQLFTDEREEQHKIYYEHAYSVVECKQNNGELRLVIVNPHDTSRKRFEMSSQEFIKYFRSLDCVRIRGKYAREEDAYNK